MMDLGNVQDYNYPYLSQFMKEINGSHDCKNDEPPPEENKDLLVEDINWKNALSVVPLDLTTWSVLVEGALGHPGEHPGHRVDPLVRCGVVLTTHPLLEKRACLHSVPCELVAEEYVGEVDLHDDVDEVQGVADEDLDAPHPVVAAPGHGLDKIPGEVSFRGLPLLLVKDKDVERPKDLLHPTPLCQLVNQMRGIEHECLQRVF